MLSPLSLKMPFGQLNIRKKINNIFKGCPGPKGGGWGTGLYKPKKALNI